MSVPVQEITSRIEYLISQFIKDNQSDQYSIYADEKTHKVITALGDGMSSPSINFELQVTEIKTQNIANMKISVIGASLISDPISVKTSIEYHDPRQRLQWETSQVVDDLRSLKMALEVMNVTYANH